MEPEQYQNIYFMTYEALQTHLRQVLQPFLLHVGPILLLI